MINSSLLKKINLYYQLTKNLHKTAGQDEFEEIDRKEAYQDALKKAHEDVLSEIESLNRGHATWLLTPEFLTPQEIKDIKSGKVSVNSLQIIKNEVNVAKLEFIEKWFNDYFQELEKEIKMLKSQQPPDFQQVINEKISETFKKLTDDIPQI